MHPSLPTLMGILRFIISAYLARMSQGAEIFRKLVFLSADLWKEEWRMSVKCKYLDNLSHFKFSFDNIKVSNLDCMELLGNLRDLCLLELQLQSLLDEVLLELLPLLPPRLLVLLLGLLLLLFLLGAIHIWCPQRLEFLNPFPIPSCPQNHATSLPL